MTEDYDYYTTPTGRRIRLKLTLEISGELEEAEITDKDFTKSPVRGFLSMRRRYLSPFLLKHALKEMEEEVRSAVQADLAEALHHRDVKIMVEEDL